MPVRDVSSRWSRWRYLIDIVIVLAAAIGTENLLGRVYAPTDFRSGVIFATVSKVPAFLVAWLLIRRRGESLATLGLKRPRSWPRTLLVGCAVAIVILGAVFVSERLGFHRDLTAFSAIKGNRELTVYQVCYVLVGAGFYEEFMFRGFLLHGLSRFFGGSRVAATGAAVLQAALFGLAHAYQNPVGVAITGMIGLGLALLYFGSGRNLWPLIIAHGLYDAARTILFYWQGVPA